MKTMHAHLRLSTSLSVRNRDRCPYVFFSIDGEEHSAIRTDTEHPQLPLGDGSVHELVLHDDALSRAIDEEAWLQELGRVIVPGGKLRFTVPASGPFAWLDSNNIYRYLIDISHRGDAPDASLPTGWNRHYSRNSIHQLVQGAGFGTPAMCSQNYASSELQLLAGFVRDNWIRRDQQAENQLFQRYGRRDPGCKSSLLRTTWSVVAIKTH